ncbi:hypothetical protein R1flu_016924 [Riccia fluitans]|uniref:Ribosomal protein L7/L12 C-terminal domain-containing protein n=1 Tax=Riccia fluitans TaxID=41844 RepID=A0ABD1YN77_9MARC
MRNCTSSSVELQESLRKGTWKGGESVGLGQLVESRRIAPSALVCNISLVGAEGLMIRGWAGQDVSSREYTPRIHSLSNAGPRLRGQPVNSDESDFDPMEARSPPSEKILRLVGEISSLTLLEISDLTTLLRKNLGLPNIPMGTMMMGGMVPGQGAGGGAAAAAPEEKKPEKTAFDVKLESFDASAKIKIFKEVRTFTALGLKEAKELVEKIPAILKKGVSKEEATQIIDKIKAVGGVASME